MIKNEQVAAAALMLKAVHGSEVCWEWKKIMREDRPSIARALGYARQFSEVSPQRFPPDKVFNGRADNATGLARAAS
jgi:hypothetical protein